VVIDEPSVVAINKITGEVIAMVLKRTRCVVGARDVAVIAPLVDGLSPTSKEPGCSNAVRIAVNLAFRRHTDHERSFEVTG
jgi:hypothetical protein